MLLNCWNQNKRNIKVIIQGLLVLNIATNTKVDLFWRWFSGSLDSWFSPESYSVKPWYNFSSIKPVSPNLRSKSDWSEICICVCDHNGNIRFSRRKQKPFFFENIMAKFPPLSFWCKSFYYVDTSKIFAIKGPNELLNYHVKLILLPIVITKVLNSP